MSFASISTVKNMELMYKLTDKYPIHTTDAQIPLQITSLISLIQTLRLSESESDQSIGEQFRTARQAPMA